MLSVHLDVNEGVWYRWEELLLVTVRLDLCFGWRLVTNCSCPLPLVTDKRVRVADALFFLGRGSWCTWIPFFSLFWAMSTRCYFASSWGKKKLAVSAVNSEHKFIFPCFHFREENKTFGLAAISTQLFQERLSRYDCFVQKLSKIRVILNNCLTRAVQYSDLYLVYLQRGTEEIRLHYPKTKLKPTRSAETSRCQHMPCHHFLNLKKICTHHITI